DQNQNIVWQASYDPFGQANISVSTVTNNLRFPGMYADTETGLYYNMNRYYYPAIGRYIEPDPILQPVVNMRLNTSLTFNKLLSILVFNPQQLYEYVYARNNPLHWIDPLGLAFYLPNTQIESGSQSKCPCGKVYAGTAQWVIGGCKCFWQCVISGQEPSPNNQGKPSSTGWVLGGEPNVSYCICNDPDGKQQPVELPPPQVGLPGE
ncbi:TPA: RHS repeat-associated core domain-containing protein, partial [Candidatus Poribacteria bacterium]|nr:RHS repeat-associated core domain-containing protein [Candidatus Poribacteria bacterium]